MDWYCTCRSVYVWNWCSSTWFIPYYSDCTVWSWAPAVQYGWGRWGPRSMCSASAGKHYTAYLHWNWYSIRSVWVSLPQKVATYCPTKILIVIVLYVLSAVPTDVLPLNTSFLTFEVGDTQECVPIQVVDDNLLEDTESFFVSIFSVSSVTTVPANRSSANVIISDNEGTNNK